MGAALDGSCCCTQTPSEQPSISFQSVRPDFQYARQVEGLPNLTLPVCETVQLQKTLKPLQLQPSNRGELLEPYYLFDREAYYLGQWLNGVPHGYGKLIYDDRCYFEGQFIDGHSSCKDGLYVYPDGSSYRGEVFESQANGKGKLTIAGDLMEYEGEWVGDKPEGYGIEKFRDGSKYHGWFVQGLKHGKGVFQWSDGSKYQGQFSKGLIQGNGALTLADGHILKGTFKHGTIRRNTGVPDYHEKYAGNFFAVKLPGVASLDAVRQSSSSSRSENYFTVLSSSRSSYFQV